MHKSADDRLTVEGMSKTWAADQKDRANPENLTQWFHSSVPVLKYLDWKVTETGRGYAKTVLPINETSTNQHITHQAAVILIAADYTGGVALTTLLHKVPVVGVNPQQSDYGAYLWGAKAKITWILPSCDDLVCTARVPTEKHEQIARRFFRGSRVLETVRIDMTNNGVLVAQADITYWVQDTYALRKNAFDETKIHPLYEHRQRTSARLAAGLAALEQDRPQGERLFNDPFSAAYAGRHGKTLARRFSLVAPQIQPIVAARTKNLDDALRAFHQGKPCQIINIGAGFDSLPHRVPLPCGSTLFDLDLPSTLRRRREVLAELPKLCARLIEVPIDLRHHDLFDFIAKSGEYDPAQPVFILWQGGSMYFDRDALSRILASVGKLAASSSHAQFWMDYALSSLVDNTAGRPEVEGFVDGMRCLGEPFISGFNDIETDLAKFNLSVTSDTTAGAYYPHVTDPVYGLYRFCITKPAKTGRKRPDKEGK